MRALNRAALLLDTYGTLWLAVFATLALGYLYTPAMTAIQAHERQEIQRWQESISTAMIDCQQR